MATTAVPFSQNAATVRRRRADRRTTTGAPSAVVSGVAAGVAPGITSAAFRQDRQDGFAVPLQFGRADAGEPGQLLQRRGPGLGDGRQGGVGEDHEGRNLGRQGDFLAPLPQRVERLLLVRGRALAAAPDLALGAAGQHAAADPAGRRPGRLPARRGALPRAGAGDGSGRRPSRKRDGLRLARPPGVRAVDQDRDRCSRARVMPT